MLQKYKPLRRLKVLKIKTMISITLKHEIAKSPAITIAIGRDIEIGPVARHLVECRC